MTEEISPKPVPALKFKIASEPWEFEAIHRLNYKTFAEEIPQHARNDQHRLVDKFHPDNTYAICLRDQQLAGMVAGRTKRPFSLDGKLADLDGYLPPGRKVLEVRLLSVEKEFRNGFVFSRFVGLLAQHFREQGFDLAIISGTLRQTRLYRHLGFVPFGPIVGQGDAQFQPMYLTLETFLQMARQLSPPSAEVSRILVNYLPGPVDVHEEVREAFAKAPVSHRSELFAADFKATQRMLCELAGARSVEIFAGSGTLANDVIGGQLSLLDGPGLVLSNGEFGERLIDHATRWGLRFEPVQIPWGERFDLDQVAGRMAQIPSLQWLWAVHCETSTGIMNDLPGLKNLCAARGVKLCLDCVSSVGTAPVDLGGTHLASCVSGKGLAAFPGLSMVFYNHAPAPSGGRLPRYLDLEYYAANGGIPFTHSSNLLYALQTALRRIEWPAKFRQLAEVSAALRARLLERGFQVLAPEAHASPAIFTVVLPQKISSRAIGWGLHQAGYLLSYRSEYLLKRNWIQICLMGEWSHDHLLNLPEVMDGLYQETGRAGNAE